MILSTLSVRRPIAASVANLLILVFGLFAVLQLSVREAPDINPPIVTVNTDYTGAAAEVVENRVTKIVEDFLSGIEGVRSISSVSREGRSRVTIEFSLDRDIDIAANDVRDRINRALRDLPEDIEAPRIQKADEDADEVMWLTLRGAHLNPMAMTDVVERQVVDRLSSVDGVAQINIGGETRYAMRIWLDRQAMAARQVTTSDIEAALRRENVELPAGRLEGGAQNLTVRQLRGYSTPEDFARLPIRVTSAAGARGAGGGVVRLGEVARVEIGPENPYRFFRANGRQGIGLGIIAQSEANVLDVAKGVRAEMTNILRDLPDTMDVGVSYDSSVFVRAALEEVLKTLGIAVLLVMAVIYLFLGSARMTLIAATAIPVSLIGALLAMWIMGFTINVLTLLAFVLAAGLVVDDAIVVVESIWRRFERGERAENAAIKGAGVVGLAVLATSAVLVAVFTPLALQQGNVGRLFLEFALTMAATVVVSTLVALTLVPALAGRLLGRSHAPNALVRLVDTALSRSERGYRRLLGAFLGTRLPVLAVLLAAAGAAVLLYRGLPQELVPREDRGGFYVVINAPEGASYDYAVTYAEALEETLDKRLRSGEVDQALTAIFGGATQRIRGIVALADYDKRDKDIWTIISELGADLRALPGITAFVRPRPSIGQTSGGRPLQVVIGGPTYEDLAVWRDRMERRMAENPGIVDADSDYDERRPQLRLSIDRERAASLGISAEEVGRTLQTALGSRTVGTFVERGTEYDVIIQAEDSDRRTPGDISGLYVRTTGGDLVPLSNLVHLEEAAAAAEYNRYNRMRAVTISAGLAADYTLGEAITFVRQIAAEELPDAASLQFKGESKELEDASQAGALTFVLALAVVFLVLAALFESLRLPVMIMMTVPLAVTGALFGLWVTGQSVNIYSEIGVVMLVGLAAKNGILLVEFANQLREDGMAPAEAAVEAAVARLRPVLMTAVSTAAGAVPLIVGTGAGSETRFVLGVVVLSGITFATILTLLVVPALYRWGAGTARASVAGDAAVDVEDQGISGPV